MTPADWKARFAQLASEKTQQATAAHLWPYETEHVAEDAGATAIESPWSTKLFGGPFYLAPSHAAARPACSLVFVQSADGNTVAPNPSALGGGETDKHLIYEGLSRVAADGVLSGAETVRDSDIVFSVWHPELVALRSALGLPRHPTQIIATLRGLPIERMLMCNVPEIPVIVITVPDGARQMREAISGRPWISVVTMAKASDLPQAFAELGAHGIRRVSSVGGRTLASHLLHHGLIDDLHLTTAPRPGGEPGTPISDEPWRGRVLLRKRGTGAEAGVVFEHLLPRRE